MLLVYPTLGEGAFLRGRALRRESWRGRELLLGEGWRGLELGIGKVNTAAVLASYLQSHEVERVLLLGIAGAYPHSALRAGDVAVAAAEVQADLGTAAGLRPLGVAALRVGEQDYYNRFPSDPLFSAELAARVGRRPLVFLTRDKVSESPAEAAELAAFWEAALENMEGAALAQTAAWFGVPWAEVRAVSNEAGVRDKSRWRTDLALQALAAFSAGLF